MFVDTIKICLQTLFLCILKEGGIDIDKRGRTNIKEHITPFQMIGAHLVPLKNYVHKLPSLHIKVHYMI